MFFYHIDCSLSLSLKSINVSSGKDLKKQENMIYICDIMDGPKGYYVK